MKRYIKYRHKRQGGISKSSKVSSVLDPIEDCWEIRAEEWTSEKGKKNGRNRRQERRALKSGQKGSEKIPDPTRLGTSKTADCFRPRTNSTLIRLDIFIPF